jgi:hypothetical protein
MKKYIVFALVLLAVHSIYGQDKRIIPINISYFGDSLLHPGIEIGYENTFYKWFKGTSKN